MDDIILWSADITSPHFLSIWEAGSTQTISWIVNKVPQTGPTAQGKALLGYAENDSENLDLDNPLATGFLIGDGNVTFTVPDVPYRSDYIVVLFGNSGNSSPTFTIMPKSH
ncbi:hypothetical protein FOMPIDRAFT_43002 [Fomitopsis schrenkii]|uniref:Uncharacterized protein n=1 Tax=Fomitopsis schrenkii TaxID=2126942 RepID=S8G4K0_FOMSC|nr:hypothetical protein FOMPIDRAFT_43002 [Fomitopsis schrenkii]